MFMYVQLDKLEYSQRCFHIIQITWIEEHFLHKKKKKLNITLQQSITP